MTRLLFLKHDKLLYFGNQGNPQTVPKCEHWKHTLQHQVYSLTMQCSNNRRIFTRGLGYVNSYNSTCWYEDDYPQLLFIIRRGEDA